jgi:hypothetical protein
MNPNASLYQRPDTEATIVGDALHSYLLDGAAAFTDIYVRRPDDPVRASSADKSAVTKAAKKALMPHQTLLHGDDWRLVMDAGRTITEHPDLAEVFSGGDHEVSVFWTNDLGIRCKARFDILKPGGIGDLKSIANQFGDRLENACKIAIKQYKYHIQAEHYLEGRRQLPRLFKQEKVFVCIDGTAVDIRKGSASPASMSLIRDRLMECVKVKDFAFQFIFISKEAPEAWACTLSQGNPILEHARNQIADAFQIYAHMKENYGAKPWPEMWRLSELYLEEMPGGEWGWS